MNGIDLANLLSGATPVSLIALLIVALLKGWLILPSALVERDQRLADRDKRIRELEGERDEYKGMAFRALDIGERITSATEHRDRR